MKIDSANPIVRHNLQLIADLIIDNGGTIHSKLTVHHQNEMLWISCQAVTAETPLFIIPNALFVPVSDLSWHNKNDLLVYEGETDYLTETQQQLLSSMMAIYNESGKIRSVAEKLPSVQLKQDAALLSWVQSAHPTFKLPDENPASQFIGTRLNEVPSEQDPSLKIGCLMPLIDYMNHHPYGASYVRTDNGAWQVDQVQAVTGSQECFLRYTNTDSHSIAFWHGYCEENTRHVASVQCQLQHSIIGTVYINSTNAKRRMVNAPSILPHARDLVLQDLVLENKQIPALRTFLGLAVRSKHRHFSQHDAEIIANELIQLLIDANIEKYQELQQLCQSSSEKFPLRPLFSQMGKHQLALLCSMRA